MLDADSIEAFNTINAKRVDFLLVDADQRPRLAIEYQGQCHHQGTAAARDAVKREALRQAGVGYGEVFVGDGPHELAQVMAGAGGTGDVWGAGEWRNPVNEVTVSVIGHRN